MRKILSFLTVSMLLVCPVLGQEVKRLHVLPNVKIQGAETPIPYGELVQITAKEDVNSDNLASRTYSWKVYDENFKNKNVYTSPDGKTLIFGAGIKKTQFKVALEATYTFVDKDADGKVVGVETLVTGILDEVVKIGDDDKPIPVPPTPDPDKPEPPPVPPIPKPDSPLGIVQPSIDAYKAMVATNKDVIAMKIASNYRTVKNNIAAGNITTLKEAYAQLTELNGKDLRANNGNFTEWNAWDQVIKKSVFDLYTAKKLAVIHDYIGAYAEIADSLDYAASTEKK